MRHTSATVGYGRTLAGERAMAEPDPACPLDASCQRHVVDQRIAHRIEAAHGGQGCGAYQHRAAGCGGHARAGIVHQRERIEQLEEEHEGRHQRPLGRAGAMQRDHFGDHVQPVTLKPGNQGRQVLRPVDDVGVAEQQQRAVRCGYALRKRPKACRSIPRAWARLAGRSAAGPQGRGRHRRCRRLLPSSTSITRQGPA